MNEMRHGKDAYMVKYMQDGLDEVAAWELYASGKNDEALKMLRAVADRQDKIGKGEADLPVREGLASVLMELGRPQEALAEYEAALKTDPNRFAGLYGAAQAAMKLGQRDKSSEYMAQLLKNCEKSGSSRPELVEARTVLAAR
jgi:tetratricopeptide (TPR) repeat protein